MRSYHPLYLTTPRNYERGSIGRKQEPGRKQELELEREQEMEQEQELERERKQEQELGRELELEREQELELEREQELERELEREREQEPLKTYPMKPEIKKQWVQALRSGEYKQGRGQLKQGATFCCLGVLCDLAVQSGELGSLGARWLGSPSKRSPGRVFC